MKKYVIILFVILVIISVLLRIDVDLKLWNALIPIFFIALIMYGGVKGLQLEKDSLQVTLKNDIVKNDTCPYCNNSKKMTIGTFKGERKVICFCNYPKIKIAFEKVIEELSSLEHCDGLCYHVSRHSAYAADYIMQNRPKWYQRFYSYSYRNDEFFWRLDNINVRIEFLKYHIKKIDKIIKEMKL